MKKMGILTFFDNDNYGALLQAFALMSTLKKLDVKAEFISLSDTSKFAPDNIDGLPALIRKLKIESFSRHLHFENFREKWLPFVNFSNLLEADYDLFIVGSDQVWNPEIIGKDNRFFLSFTDSKKRAAYAVSIGKQILDDSQKNQIKNQISGFGGLISVREKVGAELIKEMCGVDVNVCLDPTLLTIAEDWMPIIQSEPYNNKKPYLLLIMVQSDSILYEKAEKIAREKGLELKLITASYFPRVGFEPWSKISVPKYLELIKNAEYVLSSSFHGIALSIVFQKEFGFSSLKGDLESRNIRVIELLDSLGLSDRKDYCDDTIEWDDVCCKLTKLKQESLEFLYRLAK